MITITNQKIAGFEPRWANFRGYSLLFDNPGQSLTPSGALLALDCSVGTDPELGFYKALDASLSQIGRELLTRSYLFCPLPSLSYHVTVWDGGNDANAGSVTSDYRPQLEAQLKGLPASLSERNPLTEVVLASALASYDAEIVFRFDRLLKWGNSVLVAALVPSEETEAQFQDLVQLRGTLIGEFAGRFNIKASVRYSPHVSLGYFANEEAAEQATPFIDAWSEAIREQIRQLSLTFRSVSLYGFTDMAHFFKKGSKI